MFLCRIGRHSKSLDTQKFVCALCTGQLILLTPVKPRAPTPFATFVKENYGNVRQELVGQSHAEVMRKLSADFASKTKLSESWWSRFTANLLPHSVTLTALATVKLYQILSFFFPYDFDWKCEPEQPICWMLLCSGRCNCLMTGHLFTSREWIFLIKIWNIKPTSDIFFCTIIKRCYLGFETFFEVILIFFFLLLIHNIR